MSPDSTAEYNEILARLQSWTPQQRLHLATDLLRSLPRPTGPDGLRGAPVEKVRGVAAGDGTALDDATVRRWMEEHLLEKYG